MQRHRHQEFIRFLNAVERAVPAAKVIHVILDNYAAHKHANVRRWLTRHPRWIFHFTPTSCSWLNAVETVFAKLAKRQLKRGVFPSVVALQEAINHFLAAHNRDPKPFVGKPTPRRSSPPPKRRAPSVRFHLLVLGARSSFSICHARASPCIQWTRGSSPRVTTKGTAF